MKESLLVIVERLCFCKQGSNGYRSILGAFSTPESCEGMRSPRENSEGKAGYRCRLRWLVTWNDAWVAIGRMQIENQYPLVPSLQLPIPFNQDHHCLERQPRLNERKKFLDRRTRSLLPTVGKTKKESLAISSLSLSLSFFTPFLFPSIAFSFHPFLLLDKPIYHSF